MAVITLLTDFGLADPFVGQMHGVIASRCPEARIVDLSHGVAPQDVAQASFWLSRSYGWFPPATVHVAVVDPGVGSSRAAIVIEADRHVFLAPDNGLCTPILALPDARVHRIDTDALGLSVPSRTFHGRDVFAPIAAEIAAGRLSPAGVGPSHTAEQSERAAPVRDARGVAGHVVVVDHFGNLITDIDRAMIDGIAEVELAGRRIPLRQTYADVGVGELVAVVSSFGTLEVACREGNAANMLSVATGAEVRAVS
jgi:hypothetical protein